MSTAWTTETKPGKGWQYDSSMLNYDSASDPIENLVVYYDALGTATVWSALNKP